ncbi:uncharacterized protein C4orf45 [Myripristis murdjan]|uniref:Uncharacterized protein n=1 Tax=Myripristis murdjan TaxID=586833 RepID=A0A667ZIJ5_9TELE|nr:uncharacterized protein C4orf45 homolog [Myripristis murdjan]
MSRKNKVVADETPRGQRIIFTGPDGIGDYRPRSYDFPHHIGVGNPSPESTGDLGYLSRAAPGAPPLLPKQSYVGGIGWAWQYSQLLNSGALLSDMQIKKSELRTALEDSVTHRFQNPEQAVPQAPDKQSASQSRTHINDTDSTDKRKHSAGNSVMDASQHVSTGFQRDGES